MGRIDSAQLVLYLTCTVMSKNAESMFLIVVCLCVSRGNVFRDVKEVLWINIESRYRT